MTSDRMPVALVTNAAGFAGPGAVASLLEGGFRVYAQDDSFPDNAVWNAFREERAELFPIGAEDAPTIISHVAEREPVIDAIISNDHYPAPRAPPDRAEVRELQSNYRSLVEAPFRLIQQALTILRGQNRANIILVTSNRTRLPLSGAAFPDAARAAANALVRSLAIDCAADGIVVNAVAPNFLYSEAYYPKSIFAETQEGRDYIANSVPAGRLADPSEIGEVICFLASMKTRFLTGAVIDFSGGWPSGEPRPVGTVPE